MLFTKGDIQLTFHSLFRNISIAIGAPKFIARFHKSGYPGNLHSEVCAVTLMKGNQLLLATVSLHLQHGFMTKK